MLKVYIYWLTNIETLRDIFNRVWRKVLSEWPNIFWKVYASVFYSDNSIEWPIEKSVENFMCIFLFHENFFPSLENASVSEIFESHEAWQSERKTEIEERIFEIKKKLPRNNHIEEFLDWRENINEKKIMDLSAFFKNVKKICSRRRSLENHHRIDILCLDSYIFFSSLFSTSFLGILFACQKF